LGFVLFILYHLSSREFLVKFLLAIATIIYSIYENIIEGL